MRFPFPVGLLRRNFKWSQICTTNVKYCATKSLRISLIIALRLTTFLLKLTEVTTFRASNLEIRLKVSAKRNLKDAFAEMHIRCLYTWGVHECVNYFDAGRPTHFRHIISALSLLLISRNYKTVCLLTAGLWDISLGWRCPVAGRILGF
jgi:hypothetical protein